MYWRKSSLYQNEYKMKIDFTINNCKSNIKSKDILKCLSKLHWYEMRVE